MKTPRRKSPGPSLRRRAEAKFAGRSASDLPPLSAAKTAELIHELGVHQIELELQNEELRRAQLDLQASHSRYADLYDHAPVGYLTLDDAGRVLEVNHTAAGLLGLSVLTMTGKPFTQYILPEDQDTFYWHRRQLSATGKSLTCELRLVRPDGTAFWTCIEGMRVREPVSGKTVYRAALSDINERRATEAALRESEARLRLSVESANVGLWDWNLVTNEVIFSPEWKSQIGYRDNEILNEFSEWEKRVHPDDLAPTLQRVQAFLAKPQAYHEVEFRLRHKNGSYRWIYTHANVLRDETGKPVRMLGCHIDITELKEAEANLRDTQVQLESALAAGSVGTWIWDLVNNRAYADDYLSDLFLIDKDSVAHGGALDTFFQAIDENDRPRIQDAIERAIKFDEKYEVEFRARPGNRELRWLLGRGRIERDAAGKPLRFLGMLMDITQRKEAEQEAKAAAERLRALSARLDSVREEEGKRIAREIHDELGGALTGIKWDIEGIDKTLAEALAEEKLGTVRGILAGISELVDSTIDTVRRISSDLRPALLDDLGLVPTIEWQASQFKKRTGIQCTFSANSDARDISREGATAVFRILQEVLTNIIRHAKASNVAIELSRSEGWLELTVQDNGRGITEAERADAHSIGLLGMSERARLVGGVVEINGIAGKGTKVSIRLPINPIPTRRARLLKHV